MKLKRNRLMLFVGVTGVILVLVYALIGSRPKSLPTAQSLLRKDPQLERVIVADVTEALALDETKASYSTEPPGKLRTLRWSKVKLPGAETEADVEVDIVYTPDLFSEKFEWDIKTVRAATVTEVTISPSAPNK